MKPVLLLAAILFVLPLRAQNAGFGPPISVLLEDHAPRLPKARNLIDQTPAAATAKSVGCIECHKGIENMHTSTNVVLGCTDCHGGNPTPGLTMRKAHVEPLNPLFWESSANPNTSSVLLNHESPEFIQFVNPGDLRVADRACGLCHKESVDHVWNSMMNHGALLWGAALYNNGAVPFKNYRYGQAYGADGAPLRLESPVPVTPEDTRLHGILPFIEPLPHFELSQPSNVLRIFEKGGEKQSSLGLPNPEEDPGRPARRLSERGLGTSIRTDPVFLNLQKMRLHDPTLGFLGSNNHPGDYRSSGCSACHVVYANDRSPTQSAYYSKYGNQGLSFTADPSIPKNERGHPITHQLTRAIPSSQCMVCHMHQGDMFVNPYFGYTWWDQESDGEFMYPKKQKNPTEPELTEALRSNPEAAAARGNWDNPDFLDKVAELNPQLKETQFADYHGHGWVFRAVFKKDHRGNLLDLDDKIIPNDDPHKFAKAVHLKDIHLAKGMQCVDCHFLTDVHGNGLLYGESRAATTIECIDCHGTITQRPTLTTSGNGGKIDLNASSTPWGARFVWDGKKLFQRATLSPDVRWEVPQTMDTIDPQSSHYNPKSRYAKTIRRDGETWGDVPASSSECKRFLAHENSSISCQICHSSWATACFGCHLSMKANERIPQNKYEGITTRNYTSYNPQVVRDDVFMLGIDSTVKNHRMAVIRSSSAVIVSSQNANRDWSYSQQQTISAEGYSGQAFNPHFPHTTSGVGTTKNCADCHLSKQNDNNAIMTQLLGFGTGTVNFFGRYTYVAEGTKGLDAVVWTEREEPQAAIGSHLQEMAYPDNFKQHEAANQRLKEAYHHDGDNILDLTLRGEYLYTANGPGGFRVYDVANVDQKSFSERIVTAPVSPAGQRLYVRTKFATSVALPSTLALDPARVRLPENEEQPIHSLYGYVYVTDREEGLIIVFIATLVDGNPENNFLKRDVVFNPEGRLNGATYAFVGGHYLYVTCTRGIEIIDINDPTKPKIVSEVRDLKNPKAVAVQFRYAFVTDEDGLKVIDILNPEKPALIPGGFVKLSNAQRLYAARTYAYVANGAEGLAIIDIENPEKPKLDRMFNANGALNDTRAVEIGSVNASMFALVADGRNGLRVLQMISPDTVPGYMGFSPMPAPKLIATYQTAGAAVAVSRGLDRDRVVDETGDQTVVFGRRGSRPFNTEEMKEFYEHYSSIYPNGDSDRRTGDIYKVSDVAVDDGDLKNRDGSPLQAPADFKSAEPETPTAIASRDRIFRRGK